MLAQPFQTIQHLKKKRETSGDNILIDMFLASTYSGVKKNDDAFAILSKRDKYAQNDQVFFIHFWDYMLAKSYYYKENYPKAELYFAGFLKNHKGSLFKNDATFRLAMALSLSGKTEKAQRFFRVMHTYEDSGFEEDEYASSMAKQFREEAPDSCILALFRARNLYDGGYYARALSVLEELEMKKDMLAPSVVTEIYYRYARIYHTIGNWKQAEHYYQLCIEQPPSEQLWLQVYSHYFLAELARSNGDLILAKVQYEKALSFDEYFYQAGLENRCKVALAELK